MSASISRPRPPLIVDPVASLHSSPPQVFPIGTALAKFLPSWSYAAPKLASCFISKLASRTVLEAPPLCSPFRTRAADNTHWSVSVQCGLGIHKSTIFLHHLFFIGSKRVMIVSPSKQSIRPLRQEASISISTLASRRSPSCRLWQH